METCRLSQEQITLALRQALVNSMVVCTWLVEGSSGNL
jgi:hypothetical protein